MTVGECIFVLLGGGPGEFRNRLHRLPPFLRKLRPLANDLPAGFALLFPYVRHRYAPEVVARPIAANMNAMPRPEKREIVQDARYVAVRQRIALFLLGSAITTRLRRPPTRSFAFANCALDTSIN